MAAVPQPEEAVAAFRERWQREQLELKERCVLRDDEACPWAAGGADEAAGPGGALAGLTRVAGVDISFAKGNDVDACITIAVLEYPSLQVVHELTEMVALDLPYIPGFLAFREVPHIVRAYERLRVEAPDKLPQVLMFDGNGSLHPLRFGAACHMGVLLDVPTIGVAKNFLAVDGMTPKELKARLAAGGQLAEPGARHPIIGETDGVLYGYAVRCTKEAVNPVFVSPGHRVSMETAVKLVMATCKVRVPEPVRQADFRSREFLRARGML